VWSAPGGDARSGLARHPASAGDAGQRLAREAEALVILFFEYGRLGNQLFQYVGLKKYFPKDDFIFFVCEDLHQFFDNVDVRLIRKNTISQWIVFGLFKRIVFFLRKRVFLGESQKIRAPIALTLLFERVLSRDYLFR